jgi:RNA polymerase-binding transcription factor
MDEARARAQLSEERGRVEELLREAAATAADDRAARNEPGDIADRAEPLTTQQTEEAVAEGLRARLAALDRAERRIEQGTYGYSVRSGVPIPDARLEADPAAELTVEEAQES